MNHYSPTDSEVHALNQAIANRVHAERVVGQWMRLNRLRRPWWVRAWRWLMTPIKH